MKIKIDAPALADELTSVIQWRPIRTAPLGERIFVADLIDGIRYIGIAEQGPDGRPVFVCPGIPTTPAWHWTHWAPMPKLPRWKSANAAPSPARN